eukprot:1473559-Alexandrium_andersonii.AAC.1
MHGPTQESTVPRHVPQHLLSQHMTYHARQYATQNTHVSICAQHTCYSRPSARSRRATPR